MVTYEAVIRRWLTRPSKPLKNKRMPVDGDCIYSYGRHFLIARVDRDNNVVYLTTARHSMTTNRHVGYVNHWSGRCGFAITEVPNPILSPEENGRAWGSEYVELLSKTTLARYHLYLLEEARAGYLQLSPSHDAQLETSYQEIMKKVHARGVTREKNTEKRVRKALLEWVITYGENPITGREVAGLGISGPTMGMMHERGYREYEYVNGSREYRVTQAGLDFVEGKNDRDAEVPA